VTRSVVGKELRVLWASPLPYVLGAVLHATLGVLGWSQIVGRGQAVFQPLVPIAGFLLLIVTPILAARTFSDEIRSGTLELLLAIPVSIPRLVAGKYLALVLSLWALLAPAGLFVLLLALYGAPDVGPILTGCAGLLLFGAALGGIGLLASSLTASQPVAAIGALFAVLALWFAHTGSDAVVAGGVLDALSVSERLRSFAGGVVDLSDVTFFISVCVGAAAATIASVASRRWR
jgi:ABC-2 type transport system permease protein